ncbi:hypothetical protein [Mariniflexile sp.]|uniref:hypothetical protein n=1 Tax=Mariniflexile sp. TaxID=1979402 RepID=UPI00356221A1
MPETATVFKSIILPTVTLLYCLSVKRKSLFFTFFLVLFSVSDLLVLIENFLPGKLNYDIGNVLYILAYASLIIEIGRSISFPHILKNYKLHLFVLAVLNIYIIYVLQVIVGPHYQKGSVFYIELIYNVLILLLLSMSLLNYFYHDNVKSFYLFLASLFIVFGEVLWIAYTYIAERNLLNVISTTLFGLSCYFFFKQAVLSNIGGKKRTSTLFD